MADLLEEEMGKGAFRPLLHCYTGGADLARRAAKLGAFFAASGIVTANAHLVLDDADVRDGTASSLGGGLRVEDSTLVMENGTVAHLNPRSGSGHHLYIEGTEGRLSIPLSIARGASTPRPSEGHPLKPRPAWRGRVHGRGCPGPEGSQSVRP